MIKEDVIHCKELFAGKIRKDVTFILDDSGVISFKDKTGFELFAIKKVGNKAEIHLNGKKVLG